jgi:hypothetical protein
LGLRPYRQGFIKQVDLLYKLASRAVTATDDLPSLKSEISEISNSKSPAATVNISHSSSTLSKLFF